MASTVCLGGSVFEVLGLAVDSNGRTIASESIILCGSLYMDIRMWFPFLFFVIVFIIWISFLSADSTLTGLAAALDKSGNLLSRPNPGKNNC